MFFMCVGLGVYMRPEADKYQVFYINWTYNTQLNVSSVNKFTNLYYDQKEFTSEKIQEQKS